MVTLRPLRTFSPTDVDETLYPFNIERNVCGADRVARVIGAVLAFAVAVKALLARRFLAAAFMAVVGVMLSLNAITGRCIASSLVGVDTCSKAKD